MSECVKSSHEQQYRVLKRALAAQNVTVSFGERFQASDSVRCRLQGGHGARRAHRRLPRGPWPRAKPSASRPPSMSSTPPRACGSRRACSTWPPGCSSAAPSRRATSARAKPRRSARASPCRPLHAPRTSPGFGELPEGLRGLVDGELRAAGPHRAARPRHEHQVGRRQRRRRAGARQSGRYRRWTACASPSAAEAIRVA